MRGSYIHEDLLGWAFDVFLRGKYAGDEGLATYLTPSQVVECMAHMVFHDISDAELWARRGDKNQKECRNPAADERELPVFLCGDICCGTGRFLVGTLREIKKRILDDRLKVDDSITDPHIDKLSGKFDLIMTNPPFGSGKYDDPTCAQFL